MKKDKLIRWRSKKIII